MAQVYISGPMRGKPDRNFPAFDRAAALGRSLGWTVFNPADADRLHESKPEDIAAFNALSYAEQCRVYASRDCQILLNFRAEEGDAIALLPGWVDSTGARAELALARWVQLMIVDARTFLPLNVSLEGRENRPPMPAQFAQCGSGHCGGHEELEALAIIQIADQLANAEKLP